MKTINKSTLLFLMASLVILGVSAIDIYIASLPQMVSEFHTKEDTINLTLSAYTFGIAIGVLFIGDFSNRFGRRLVILFGTIVFSISALLIAVSSSIHLIIGLRLIQAIACSSFIIIPRMIINDVMNEKERINANGILLLGMIISPTVAPVMGAYIDKYLSWRYCFILSAVIGVVMTIVIYKILPETNQKTTSRLTSLKQYLTIYKVLLTNSVFISLTFIYAVTMGAYFAFLGISSYLYIDYWHISPIIYSYLFILLAGAYFVGNQIMRSLNKTGHSPTNIIGIGIYFSAIGIGLLIISNILLNGVLLIIMVSISVILMRTANAIIIPPTQIRIMTNFVPYSAQALGLNMCIGFSMNSIATYTVTALNYAPLNSLIILSLIPIVICLIIYKKYTKIM